MNKKRLYLAFMSLALAVGAAAAMLFYAQRADERAIQGLQAVDVFVANTQIPAGTSLEVALKNQWLDIEQVPQRLAPSGSGTEVDSNVVRNVASNDIQPGELVLLTRFVPQQQISAGLAIPVGKIAVSVNLEDPQRVGNFVRVGSKVAVFTTTGSDRESTKTRLLLSDLLVLGVGDSTGATTSQSQAPSKLITLAVTQDEAETLINASNLGSLYLALMNSKSQVTPSATPEVSPSLAPTIAP